jgi:hypothetical protein
MKPSKLMLKGFAMAGERQCVGNYYEGSSERPFSVCAIGALRLAATGSACLSSGPIEEKAKKIFLNATGLELTRANDGKCQGQTKPMSISDIAGILAAEGY